MDDETVGIIDEPAAGLEQKVRRPEIDLTETLDNLVEAAAFQSVMRQRVRSQPGDVRARKMSMATEARKALHAYVSDEAHEQWHAFAAEQGVSVSAILEVLGAELEASGDRYHQLVVAARRIDARRRRRRTL